MSDPWFKQQLQKRDEHTRKTVQLLAEACRQQDLDLLSRGLANLLIGNAVASELVFALEAVNRCEAFFSYDDNGAGGFPRPRSTESDRVSGHLSGRGLGDAYIAVLRANQELPAPTLASQALQSHAPQVLAGTIDRLVRFPRADPSLLPWLERVAEGDRFQGPTNALQRRRDFRLGVPARVAIAKTRELLT